MALGSTKLIGIVNLTGDSFSEKESSAPATWRSRVENLINDGADILEFGAESTRPGSEIISPEVELSRLAPVIEKFKKEFGNTRFAVDTRNSAVAKYALEQGAVYISDVSMGRYDSKMFLTISQFPDAELVLCHSRGTPQNMTEDRFHDYGDDVVKTVSGEWLAAAKTAMHSGIAQEKSIFDPGFGFAKSAAQQFEMLRRIDEFKAPGFRIFVGVSRKSFLGAATGNPDAAKRLGATLAAEMFLVKKNVDFIRTHAPGLLLDAEKIIAELQK